MKLAWSFRDRDAPEREDMQCFIESGKLYEWDPTKKYHVIIELHVGQTKDEMYILNIEPFSPSYCKPKTGPAYFHLRHPLLSSYPFKEFRIFLYEKELITCGTAIIIWGSKQDTKTPSNVTNQENKTNTTIQTELANSETRPEPKESRERSKPKKRSFPPKTSYSIAYGNKIHKVKPNIPVSLDWCCFTVHDECLMCKTIPDEVAQLVIMGLPPASKTAIDIGFVFGYVSKSGDKYVKIEVTKISKQSWGSSENSNSCSAELYPDGIVTNIKYQYALRITNYAGDSFEVEQFPLEDNTTGRLTRESLRVPEGPHWSMIPSVNSCRVREYCLGSNSAHLYNQHYPITFFLDENVKRVEKGWKVVLVPQAKSVTVCTLLSTLASLYPGLNQSSTAPTLEEQACWSY